MKKITSGLLKFNFFYINYYFNCYYLLIIISEKYETYSSQPSS